MSTVTAKSSWSIQKDPKTVEGKLDYLQEQVNQLNKQLSEQAAEFDKKIKESELGIKNEIEKVRLKSKDIEDKIVISATGGISTQVFGFLLMVGYVAILPNNGN